MLLEVLLLRVDLVPNTAGQGDELVGIPVHLVEASSKVIALLAGIVDVVLSETYSVPVSARSKRQ